MIKKRQNRGWIVEELKEFRMFDEIQLHSMDTCFFWN